MPAQHTYDAAGRHVKHTQTTSRVTLLPGNPVHTTITTIDAGYDGDGQQFKRVETTQINSQQPTSGPGYYLRRTVLGGQVITEYDAQGLRYKSHVYSGGALIASGTSAGLVWRYNNPVTGDGRETDGQGKLVVAAYLDPQGVDVGPSDPADNHGEPPPPEPLPQAGAYAAYLPHSLGGSGRCSVDGMETGCALVSNLLAGEAAEQCPNNECSRYNPNLNGGRGGHEYFHSYADGRSFYLPGGVNWTGNGFSLPGGLWLSFIDGIPNRFKDGRLDPQNYAQDRSDLKIDRDVFKNKKTPKHPGLPDCVKNYLSKFFDGALLDAITWEHGIPLYVPGGNDNDAFTLDDHIYFGTGKYTPLNGISNYEIELIGHEVTHGRQYRQNGSLRQKAKYLAESAKKGIGGTAIVGPSFGWMISYWGNKYETEAFDMEKKIRDDLIKNGNPCP